MQRRPFVNTRLKRFSFMPFFSEPFLSKIILLFRHFLLSFSCFSLRLFPIELLRPICQLFTIFISSFFYGKSDNSGSKTETFKTCLFTITHWNDFHSSCYGYCDDYSISLCTLQRTAQY